jgi:hypothetical protein
MLVARIPTRNTEMVLDCFVFDPDDGEEAFGLSLKNQAKQSISAIRLALAGEKETTTRQPINEAYVANLRWPLIHFLKTNMK